jgi:hypothetical protein
LFYFISLVNCPNDGKPQLSKRKMTKLKEFPIKFKSEGQLKMEQKTSTTVGIFLNNSFFLQSKDELKEPILVPKTGEVKQPASYQRMMARAIEAHLNRMLQVYHNHHKTYCISR